MIIIRRQLLKLGAASALVAGLPIRKVFAAEPLALGFQLTTWGAVGMVADALDVFEQTGVDVTINRFNSGVAARDAMVSGRVDIGVSSVSTFIVGVDKGELTGIATVAYSGASNSIMVGPDSDIATVADLRGRKVATQFGAGADYTFRTKVLSQSTLQPEDLQLVNVKFADQVAALVSGSVDAFVGTEPFPAVAEAQGLAVPLVSFEDYDLVPVMLAVNRPVLESRRDDVVAFMKGWLIAAKVFEDDLDRATQIVQAAFAQQGNRLSADVLRTALERLGVEPDFRPELVPYLQAQAEALVERNRISSVPDWNVALDPSILEAARAN